ncbi:hypothetical protein IAT40_004020 [Kwoniella sp. CBS 6097]
MSLFPSAFDTGSVAAAGPSKGFSKSSSKPNANSSSNNNSKSNKRKRPSNAGDASAGRSNVNQDDLIKSTQANLEKLMSKIEKGDFKEKGSEGRESMGGGSGGGGGGGGGVKKAKKNGDGAASSRQEREREGGSSNTPKSMEKKENINQSKSKGKGDLSAPSPAKASTPNAKNDKQPKGKSNVNNNTKTSTPTLTKGGKFHTDAAQAFEPFEIPIPSLPSGKGKVSVGGDVDGMTDMQRNMQAKLEGARFRWINEQLYSTPSTDAVAMMKKDPKIFADYHNTHRLLTSGWPSPPLPHIIKTLSPLPAGTVIADLGCGDAGLARALVPQGKIVLSYDLVGDSGWVVEADFLEKVPLPGRPGGLNHVSNSSNSGDAAESGKKSKKGKGRNGHGHASADANASEIVDVVVCCLSLMGVNWVGGIAEACRILKRGGTLQVAEVTSRFISTEAFVEKVESFGFTLEEQDSPSTHFTLFKFTKQSEVPLGPARGEKGWKERVEEGESILRGCVYKKR